MINKKLFLCYCLLFVFSFFVLGIYLFNNDVNFNNILVAIGAILFVMFLIFDIMIMSQEAILKRKKTVNLIRYRAEKKEYGGHLIDGINEADKISTLVAFLACINFLTNIFIFMYKMDYVFIVGLIVSMFVCYFVSIIRFYLEERDEVNKNKAIKFIKDENITFFNKYKKIFVFIMSALGISLLVSDLFFVFRFESLFYQYLMAVIFVVIILIISIITVYKIITLRNKLK